MAQHPRRTLTVVPATTADLSTLAQEISEAHERFTTSLRESVVHAVDCGAKLPRPRRRSLTANG